MGPPMGRWMLLRPVPAALRLPRRKPMAKSSLVIVESPAKAKTIGKYLGPGYQVKACMGHLRDLPKSTLGVDIENNFEPKYCPIKGKEDIISDLKKSAKASDTVFLATDPDREGEAISWHLKELLGLADEKARRVTFNEITKRVVSESIARPREIDQSLVDAQQARRILDRIVGYQLSPLLWKKIRSGLSAGRVQSVATRMVCDREHEIAAFQPQEYWSLDARLTPDGTERSAFLAHYHGENGKKKELNSIEEVEEVTAALKDAAFTVKTVKRQEKQRSPAAPFTTSTLQQESSRKLNMIPKRTMSIASSSMRAWRFQARARWALSPICVPTPCGSVTRRCPLSGALFRGATAALTVPRPPESTRPRPGHRTPTRPSGPAMSTGRRRW